MPWGRANSANLVKHELLRQRLNGDLHLCLFHTDVASGRISFVAVQAQKHYPSCGFFSLPSAWVELSKCFVFRGFPSLHAVLVRAHQLSSLNDENDEGWGQCYG